MGKTVWNGDSGLMARYEPVSVMSLLRTKQLSPDASRNSIAMRLRSCIRGESDFMDALPANIAWLLILPVFIFEKSSGAWKSDFSSYALIFECLPKR